MNDNYLNYNKLTFFFNKLKALFATKEDIEDLKGEDGVSITSVEQTTSSASDDGINIITVTLSDGTQSTFNIKNGSKGSGTRGSMIYWGTAITGTSTTATVFSASGVSSALANDLYINTSTWNIYQCTTAGAASAAKWAYKGNIKGATGATGANATTTAVATTSANGLMSKEMVQKLGAIDGITSDINSESNSIAASSKMVHDLNNNLSELNSSLKNIKIPLSLKSIYGCSVNNGEITTGIASGGGGVFNNILNCKSITFTCNAPCQAGISNENGSLPTLYTTGANRASYQNLSAGTHTINTNGNFGFVFLSSSGTNVKFSNIYATMK